MLQSTGPNKLANVASEHVGIQSPLTKGERPGEVIGAGVVKAHLAMNGSDEAVFTFTRADDTECTVRLCCHRRGKGRDLEVYM